MERENKAGALGDCLGLMIVSVVLGWFYTPYKAQYIGKKTRYFDSCLYIRGRYLSVPVADQYIAAKQGKG